MVDVMQTRCVYMMLVQMQLDVDAKLASQILAHLAKLFAKVPYARQDASLQV
jgi:hypothetical protein